MAFLIVPLLLRPTTEQILSIRAGFFGHSAENVDGYHEMSRSFALELSRTPGWTFRFCSSTWQEVSDAQHSEGLSVPFSESPSAQS